MSRYSFIARMPDEPGALHKAADIVKRYGGNINRLQYDRRLDTGTVFFEVSVNSDDVKKITRDLEEIGYLQKNLPPMGFLKMHVYLPDVHQPGSLHEFLNYITEAKANIAFIDFDDRGNHPERLTISLTLGAHEEVEHLLDSLKSKYRLEVLEYDTTGAKLDDTVFYVRFVQQLRTLIGNSEEDFLLSFLGDVNHVAQQMTELGKEPRQVFEKILENGNYLRDTAGSAFYADVQKLPVTEKVTLYCFQLPGGGSVFLFVTPDELVMIDTGYGIYHERIVELFRAYGICDLSKLTRIYVTHADGDHAGGAGHYTVPCYLHQGTRTIIETDNRAWGSRCEDSLLEMVYTKMINTLSRFSVSQNFLDFPKGSEEKRGPFPILDRFTVGDVELEILEGFGGHQHGQCFVCAPKEGLLFTADAVINFDHLSPDRMTYNQLAVFFVLNVHVDKDRAKAERKALLALGQELDRDLQKSGKRCLICGGHGPVSVFEGTSLVPAVDAERYVPGDHPKCG